MLLHILYQQDGNRHTKEWCTHQKERGYAASGPYAPNKEQMEKRKTVTVQLPCKGAHAATASVTPQCPVHNRLGTCPDRDGFMVVDTKKGKRMRKNCKPTPQEEKEEADRILLEREPKSEVPDEWRRVTEVPYRDYCPYLFETSTLTDTRLETHLFQARGFLQEFTRRRVNGDVGKEALEW